MFSQLTVPSIPFKKSTSTPSEGGRSDNTVPSVSTSSIPVAPIKCCSKLLNRAKTTLSLSVSMTNYLKHLSAYKPFRPSRGCQANGADKGREMGKRFDSVLRQRLVNGTCAVVNLTDTVIIRRRMQMWNEFMSNHPFVRGYVYETTQQKVVFNGISSDVDVTLVDPKTGTHIYIEIKCTNYNNDRFGTNYSRTCNNQRVLSNGLLNNEKNRHALQAALPSMVDKEGKACVLIFTPTHCHFRQATQIKPSHYESAWYTDQLATLSKEVLEVDLDNSASVVRVGAHKLALLHHDRLYYTKRIGLPKFVTREYVSKMARGRKVVEYVYYLHSRNNRFKLGRFTIDVTQKAAQ